MVAPGAPLMDRVGHELLARPALSLEHHRRVRRRDLLDIGEEPLHAGSRADEPVESVLLASLLLELAVLLDQAPALEGALQYDDELPGVHRLAEEIEGAELDRAQHGLPVLLSGHHDDCGLRIAAAGVLEEVQALFDRPRRRKAYIEEIEIGVRFAEGSSLHGIARAADFQKPLQRPGELVEKLRIVFHDDDRAGRSRLLAHGLPGGGAESFGSSASACSGSGTTPGKITRTKVPPGRPAWLMTLIVPSWKRMISAAVDRPRPTPCGFVVWKGLNSRSRRNSEDIPVPLSMISTTARLGWRDVSVKLRTRTFPSAGVASIAFSIRLQRAPRR